MQDPVMIVGMLELDRRLAQIIEQARDVPVLVSYRGHPRVMIVSHGLWAKEPQFADFVPDNHPLLALRDIVDTILGRQAVLMQRIETDHHLAVAPETICRALFIQAMYSIPTKKILHEKIGYHMVFRQFVGLQLREPLWPFADFYRGAEAVLATTVVLDLVEDILARGLVPTDEIEPEFVVDHTRLCAWRRQHLTRHADDKAPCCPDNAAPNDSEACSGCLSQRTDLPGDTPPATLGH